MAKNNLELIKSAISNRREEICLQGEKLVENSAVAENDGHFTGLTEALNIIENYTSSTGNKIGPATT